MTHDGMTDDNAAPPVDERRARVPVRRVPVRRMPVHWVPVSFAVLAGLSTVLSVAALVRTPTALTAGTGPIAIAGVLVAQAACVTAAAVGPLSARRVAPAALSVGALLGATVGVLYGLETFAEDAAAAVSRHNVQLGYVIVGVLVASSLVAGAVGAHRTGRWRDGVAAALWNAMAEYMTWYPFVLIAYHAYRGTAAQDRALRAEGTYEDFAASGMADFKAFVVQDLFGAGFYHLVAGVLLAALLGSAAAGVAVLARRGSRTPG
jgi:hypothetical protein